ncbi:reverse transcriptase domain-containing protein [Tanacetum coccineum]
MAVEDEFAPHVINFGERASGSKPNEHNVETQSLRVTPQNQAVGSKLVCDLGTMDVHRLQEPAWCRIFSITLCGAARFWYDNLSPVSMNNFHELRDKFRANFLQQR